MFRCRFHFDETEFEGCVFLVLDKMQNPEQPKTDIAFFVLSPLEDAMLEMIPEHKPLEFHVAQHVRELDDDETGAHDSALFECVVILPQLI